MAFNKSVLGSYFIDHPLRYILCRRQIVQKIAITYILDLGFKKFFLLFLSQNKPNASTKARIFKSLKNTPNLLIILVLGFPIHEPVFFKRLRL